MQKYASVATFTEFGYLIYNPIPVIVLINEIMGILLTRLVIYWVREQHTEWGTGLKIEE